MRTVYAVLLLLAWTASAGAAEDPFDAAAALLQPQHQPNRNPAHRLTLEQAEEAARVGNPGIRAAVRRVSVLEARRPAAGALDDPMLTYRGWGTPIKRPYDFNQAQNMFMFQQTLPGPGKRALRSQAAAQEVEVAQAELEAVRRGVVARVRSAFYELLRNQDELRVHDEQVALARQGMESARIKYVVGRVPQQDVLKAQIALSKLVEHLVILQQDGGMAQATLNALMGRDPSAPLEAAGEYSLPARLPSALELQRLALHSRPELVAARAVIRQSETEARLARKAYTPDFTLGAGYMLMPKDEMSGASRHAYMAELSINLPWLNRRKHDAEIAEAQAETNLQEAEFEARRTLVFLEIQEALVKASAARKLVDLYRDTLRPQAQTVLKSTRAAYQSDRTDFLNLLDSQNLSLEVDIAYFRALADLDSRMAELERAVGASLRQATEERQ